MKLRFGLERLLHPTGFEPSTPWSEVKSANRSAKWMRHHNCESHLPNKIITYQILACNMKWALPSSVQSK